MSFSSKKEELEAQGFKTYENEDIQVFWNPKMCEHAGECVRGNGKSSIEALLTTGENRLGNVNIARPARKNSRT